MIVIPLGELAYMIVKEKRLVSPVDFLVSPFTCQARHLFYFPYTGYKNRCVFFSSFIFFS